MPADRLARTLDDLERTVRAIATEFKSDMVFIIGSQAILAEWPDAPPAMTASPEIDAFPANARLWETQEKAKHPGENPEASEHINALFGEGSRFHRTHGFYIDGVDRAPPTPPNPRISAPCRCRPRASPARIEVEFFGEPSMRRSE